MANTVELVFGADQARTTSQVISDLQEIARKVEASGATKLRFSIDTKGIESAGSAIQKNVRAFSLTNVANESKKAMSAATAEMTRAKIATQNVKTESAKLVGQKQAEIAAHKSNAAAIQEEIAKLRLQKAVSSSSSGSANLNSQAVANVSYSNISNTVAELTNTKQATDELTNSFSKLALAKAAFDNAPTKANLDAYNAQKTAINSLISTEKKHQQSIHSTESDLLQYRKVLAQVEAQYNRYSANIQKDADLNAKYQTVISKLKTGVETGNFDFKDVTDARTQIADLDNTLTETGGKVETFTQKLKNLFGIHLTTALTMVGIHLLIQSLHQMMSNVVELDSEFTQFKIVTQSTDEQLVKFGNDAAKVAEQIGSSISDIVNASTVFARLGFTGAQSLDLSKLTTIYSKVADVDMSSAESNITTIVKAFNISTDNLESVLDRMTKIGNSFPVSSKQLGEGLQNAGSALAAGGNSLNQSIALLTAAMAQTQDIDKSSTGLRTISARIRNATTELESLGESVSDEYNTTAKYRGKLLALTKGQVDILNDAGTGFRSTYDILSKLSGVWNQISDIDQSAITTMIAGKRICPYVQKCA